MIYAADGSLNVTLVDGSAYTGLYSADGTYNVIETAGQGLYHPCGAYRVSTVDGLSYTGVYASDGSLNATNADSDGLTGVFHPCGALRMTGLFSPLQLGPFIWLDPSDLSTLFQDSGMTTPVTGDGEIVGAILDKSGNGHHLTQAFINSKPLYKTSGGLHWLEFVGVDDFLAVSYGATLDQPLDRVAAWQIIANEDDDQLVSGGSEVAGIIFQASTNLVMFSGAANVTRTRPDNGVDFVTTERHNGASSRFAIDNGTYGTGDAGATGTTMLTLGSAFNGAGQLANIRAYGLTQFDRLLLDPEIAQLRTYLAAKQGRVL